VENPEIDQINRDLRQSEEYGNFMQKIGWKTIKTDKMQIFVRSLGPVSISKLQRVSLPLVWTEIENILKKEKVMMCIIEPVSGRVQELEKHGFKVNKEPLLGTKTLRVDLSQNEEDIFNSFKKDCRYVLKRCHIPGDQSLINRFDLFYKIWRKSAKRKNLWIPKKKDYYSLIECFGNKVFCITIGDDAGAVILIYNRAAFYYYAGASNEGTRRDLPYLVVWTAMKEAKKRGCNLWDFEGIYDSRWPNRGWLGFTHFKKSFGGKELDFPGSFTKWRWPF
jgi:lipid II:glycine glycyltransferase (peptidoglycan interpeptide bridge formation enzyme)